MAKRNKPYARLISQLAKVKSSDLLGKVVVGKVHLHVSLCNWNHLMKEQRYSTNYLLQNLLEKHFTRNANLSSKTHRLLSIRHGQSVKFCWNLFRIKKATGT